MRRYFVVAPLYKHDTLWKVCSTFSKQSFLELYAMDDYKEEKDFDNESDAIHFIRARGYKVTHRNFI